MHFMKLFVGLALTLSFPGSLITASAHEQQISGKAPNTAVADTRIDEATRRRVIDLALNHLKRDYILPETADKMEAAIRRRQQNKEYDRITSGRQFAATLTAHLQEVSKDKHLQIEFSERVLPERTSGGEQPPEERERQRAFARAVNHGFDKVERLSGNIGYLALRTFAPVAVAADKAAAAMNLLTDTEALIVDVRYNGGGDPKMVQFLCSYLFGDQPVHLNSLYWRQTDTTEQFWTLPYVPGKKFLGKPVYVLTSGITASGAEEYAYNLKNLKRAVTVGETTSGAANPGGSVRLHPHFEIFVPRGRAISPVTKTSWEGAGVVPDVAAPADHALEYAYLLALKDVQRRGKYAGPEPIDELVSAAEKAVKAAKSVK